MVELDIQSAGIYTGVRFDIASGIGTGITGTITVSAAGTVGNVAINTGGHKFAVNDLLTINDPNDIGGRTGGSNFTVKVGAVETRLYVALTGSQKFQGECHSSRLLCRWKCSWIFHKYWNWHYSVIYSN
jgi:hypothetical protein